MNDDKICRLLLGQNYENTYDALDGELDLYIIPHSYMPDTITTQNSYIFYETAMPKAYGKIKTMKIVIQAVCHKDIVKYQEKPTGYYGLRYDVLAQLIEELLCPRDDKKRREISKQFGIGNLDLELVDVFSDKDFIGHTLTFTVPEFR